jgi:hypothetical protein
LELGVSVNIPGQNFKFGLIFVVVVVVVVDMVIFSLKEKKDKMNLGLT